MPVNDVEGFDAATVTITAAANCVLRDVTAGDGFACQSAAVAATAATSGRDLDRHAAHDRFAARRPGGAGRVAPSRRRGRGGPTPLCALSSLVLRHRLRLCKFSNSQFSH